MNNCNNLSEAPPLPMRTAQQQWQVAGSESGIKATWPHTDAASIDGKGGPCLMTWAEWESYRELCNAPTISMRVVDAEEERRWGEALPTAEDTQRIHAALHATMQEVTALILEAEKKLSLCVSCVSALKGGAQ